MRTPKLCGVIVTMALTACGNSAAGPDSDPSPAAFRDRTNLICLAFAARLAKTWPSAHFDTGPTREDYWTRISAWKTALPSFRAVRAPSGVSKAFASWLTELDAIVQASNTALRVLVLGSDDPVDFKAIDEASRKHERRLAVAASHLPLGQPCLKLAGAFPRRK